MCGYFNNLRPAAGVLPWSSRLLLSLVMSRLASLKTAVIKQDGHGMEADDMVGSIENLGGDEKFKFTLRQLQDATKVSRETLVEAKANLQRNKLIRLVVDPRDRADMLVPRWDFIVREHRRDRGTATSVSASQRRQARHGRILGRG